MKNLVAFLLVLFTTSLFAQKTISTEQRGSVYYEVYDVIKKDKKTKHGSYKKYQIKDSMLLEEGTYNMGKKTGVWNYYGSEGSIWKKYDCETNKVVFYDASADSVTNVIRRDGKTERVKLEWPLEYTGGNAAFWEHVREHVEYPELARENGISGVVQIGFWVDREGVASDHSVVKSAYDLLDAEALRVLKLVPHKWIPGKYNGETVEVYHIIDFKFLIN